MAILVLQKVITSWGKDQRGGEGAALRNRTPNLAPLPLNRVTERRYGSLYHAYWFGGEASRVVHNRLLADPPSGAKKDRCFTLDLQPTAVRVQFAWNSHCGAPRREWAQADLIAPLDHWVQIVYNGRHSGNYNGEWYYTRRAINLGLFSSLSEDLFTGSQPVDRYSLISALW